MFLYIPYVIANPYAALKLDKKHSAIHWYSSSDCMSALKGNLMVQLQMGILASHKMKESLPFD